MTQNACSMEEARRRRAASSRNNPPPDRSLQQHSKKLKRKRRRTSEEPFWYVVVQVGVTLFLICVVVFGSYRLVRPYHAPAAEDLVEESGDDFDSGQAEAHELEHDETFAPTNTPITRTAPPLKVWDLGEDSKYDAYELVKSYAPSSAMFWSLAKPLRDEFSARFGGENAARAMLERGLTRFGTKGINGLPTDLQATACRILNCNGDFKIAFGGYSVTVGRGNLFSQSFPFVMQTKLEPLFASLGIELEVRNAAIGGAPSFPYGWCIENFWGRDPDVVSWDFSMNEAGGVPQGLEAYLRQTQSLLHKKPKLIVKDTHMATERLAMLKKYVELDSPLLDPVIMHGDPATEPFMAIEEQFRPLGFQDWRKFGAPLGAPGQAAHHPSKREHEFYGWMLTMHFLSAMQLMVLHQENQLELQCSALDDKTLPPQPITTNDTSSMLYDTNHIVKCRTTFEPIVDGDLVEVVSGGMADSGSDLLMPKGAMFYNKGWVLDLSESEKLAKRQLERFGGLGFVDSKKGFYGIYNSGPISFHLPVVDVSDGQVVHQTVTTVLVCQVNERYRDPESCRPDSDLNFWIGGHNVTNMTMLDSPGTLYLGHKMCINLTIPEEAIMTSYHGQVGFNLTVRVSEMRIMKKEFACSISHVVWEEHPRKR